jgi:GNAT superfamily N-acetyltransferase
LFEAWDHPMAETVIAGIVAEWTTTPRAAFLVAEQDERLLGFVAVVARPGLSNPRPVAHLSGLVVDPGRHRSGLGSSLLEAAEAAARGWGCGRIDLGSSLDRGAAHAFYPARGYQDSRVHHAYYQKRL